jgi:hypothetical protein
MQLGTVIQLTATAQNASNTNIRPAFTFASSNPGILDIAANGFACAGTWNSPAYTDCTPGGIGVAQVTASALGATSPPTLVFVHAAIDNIQVSVVPPVNSPPPACPNQQALPAACSLPFNGNAAKYCLSQNQVQTLQATAYSQGVDITASVGPFSWNEANSSVVTTTPVVNSSTNVATNQITVSPATPGQTQIVASASGVSSLPYNVETCPVQCIALELAVNGQHTGQTSFAVSKGTAESITATAVDVQGCIVPKPPLTWSSSEPAALSAGTSTAAGSSTTAGTSSATCAAGTACAISTPQPGAAAITASCSPPTCNIGFPLNPAGLPAPFVPQPVYPVTAITGLVTGATSATNALATSQDCYSDNLCDVALYNVSTSANLPGSASPLPTPPNSLMLDRAGDKAYVGSQFGAVAINLPNLGSTTNPFTFLPASGTSLGLVVGKVLAVSRNGSTAVFSDTVSTPNQVYVVTAGATTSVSSSTAPLNINSATAAAISPDGLKVLILGNGGNTLYIYSPLQALQPPISLPTPATAIVFSSTGSFALLSGGSPSSTLAIRNTCDNSPVSLPAPLPGPPMFLTMVPAGNVPMGGTVIPNLEMNGLDIFLGLDNTGIDVIATTASAGPLTTLCPQLIALARTTQNTTFVPTHIDIGQGTFHPINFFVSPTSLLYIVASDRSSVLVYDLNTNAVSAIQLVNNATPIAADITVDGSIIYVAASDGLLHQLNTGTAIDETEISFLPLPNSLNNFCYTGSNCGLNLLAVKP